MATPENWGKLVSLLAGLRKPGFIPFGLFSPADNLAFIASLPGASGGWTWITTSTPANGVRTGFNFSQAPVYASWNGLNQFENVNYSVVASFGVWTVTFKDVNGSVLTPTSGDIIKAAV